MIKKVEVSSRDLSKWTVNDWQDLLSILKINFDTPEEQWNDTCREELIGKLEQFIQEFHKRRVKKYKIIFSSVITDSYAM